MGELQDLTSQHSQLALAIGRSLREWRAFVIAIDGVDGAGKSTLARYVSWRLGIPCIETDLFLNGAGLNYRDGEIRSVVSARLDRDRPVIVEGICVMDTLARLGLEADYLVRVEDANRIEGGKSLQAPISEYMARFSDRPPDFAFTWDSKVGAPAEVHEQEIFVRREIVGLSMRGAVQRGDVYRSGAGESDREAFRHSLGRRLLELESQYLHTVDDAAHVATITHLADDLSRIHAAVLADGRLRIGTTQKALNLFLKYQWCRGTIAEPPHCPFDGIVISHVPSMKTMRWTQLDDLIAYQQLVDEARKVAGGRSLARWELALWNRT